MNKENGLIHLYVGDGKGKTTAAVGLSVRMLGQGGRVLFCQFLKGRPTGELEPLEKMGASIVRADGVSKFVSQMTPEERITCKDAHQNCLADIAARLREEPYNLLVLDEVVDAVNLGILSLDSVLDLLHNRPEGLEAVLTGRNPPKALEDTADYYTLFQCVRHPYQRGITSRPGVEY